MLFVQSLTNTKTNFSNANCCIRKVLFSTNRFRSHCFYRLSDMKYVLTKGYSKPRLLRWIFLLQEFDFKDSWLEKRRLNVMVRLWNNFEFNPGKLKLKWISLSMIKEPFEPYFNGEVDQQAWQFHQTKQDFFDKKASSLWRETNACWEATQFCKLFFIFKFAIFFIKIFYF